MNQRLSIGSLILACGLLAQCSSSPSNSATYPADLAPVATAMGQMQSQGGTILKNPTLVTITWASDPNAAAFNDFGDKLGASKFWKTATGQYGVGAMTSGAANHVSISTELGASMEAGDIEAWFLSQLTASPSPLPAPDGNTIYVIYASPNTLVTSDGADACLPSAAVSGTLHAAVQMPDQSWVPYVLVDGLCQSTDAIPPSPMLSPKDSSTGQASHDIVEAATNPFGPIGQTNGVEGYDMLHQAWAQLVQNLDTELGDACEAYSDAFEDGATDLLGSDGKPYKIERIWSNTAGAAGHNPCQPQPSTEVYYNVAPIGMETLDLTIDAAQTSVSTYGYSVPMGTTKKFTAQYYSDAPAGFWNVTAYEGTPALKQAASFNPHLTITTIGTSGTNGDFIEVTVTTTAQPTNGNAVVITLESTAPGTTSSGAPLHTTHWMPVLIGTM